MKIPGSCGHNKDNTDLAYISIIVQDRGLVTIKLAFHMYVFQIRHPTSAKYASMLKSMLKSLCPFHMSVTRHTTPIQSPRDAYFTDHYNLTDVKFLIMTQYPWGFPILERGFPKHTCL